MISWDKLQAAIDEARRKTLGAALDGLARQKVQRDEAVFSIALIALSAKMARADGVVSTDEVTAFSRFFTYPESEADKVSMIYRLAQQDVAGFEHYLIQVAKIFEASPEVLEDVLDCLFYIAGADGVEHPREIALLESAAKAFKTPAAAYRRLRAVHLGLDAQDPYAILGVEPGISAEDLRAVYRALVREHHPDALMARGVPAALVRIGEARTAAINAAYEILSADAA
ncbi:MAG: TerB family tellurite resistance protein [Parvularculaceae bacterium]